MPQTPAFLERVVTFSVLRWIALNCGNQHLRNRCFAIAVACAGTPVNLWDDTSVNRISALVTQAAAGLPTEDDLCRDSTLVRTWLSQDLRSTKPVGHYGVGRLRWQAGPPSGPVAVTGTDVARFQDGLIQTLHVFLDPPGA
jgi:hypothetical protein